MNDSEGFPAPYWLLPELYQRAHGCHIPVPPIKVTLSLLDFPQAKLVRYICKQRQCKLSVTPSDRTAELNSYPRFTDWLYIFNVRPEVVQVCSKTQAKNRQEGTSRGHIQT